MAKLFFRSIDMRLIIIMTYFIMMSLIKVVAQTVSYEYDLAGNCIERSIIIGNKSVTIDDQDDYFVEESIAETTMKIYPNPTKGMLRVEFGTVIGKKTIIVFVYDMQGRVVFNSRIDGETNLPIDLTSSPNGIFIMKVIIGKQETSWKIIKER